MSDKMEPLTEQATQDLAKLREKKEHREKTAEYLLDFTGLQEPNKCTTLKPLTREPGERRKVDALEEIEKQAEVDEEPTQQEVHTELAKKIASFTQEEWDEFIYYASRLLNQQVC